MKISTQRAGIALAAATVVALSACAPGPTTTESEPVSASSASVTTDISKLPEQTLVVWDQEVRGGQNEQMERLNQAFMEKYPNITIERNSQSFDDLQTTLRLALSGEDAPDVVEANNARATMGQFVAAQQIIPLDEWAEAYQWKERFEEGILAYSSYSDDAVTFGEGHLYGLPQVGEVVGIYYSPKRLTEMGLEVPKTWEEFAAQLPVIKEKGSVPLMLGNVEKWPAIHVFGAVQGANVPADRVRTLGFGNAGASWKTEENVKAARQLQEWAQQGYFNEGFNGVDYDAVWQSFAQGEGAYLIAGSWLAPDLKEVMGEDVAFMAPPVSEANKKPSTTGGTGLPFAITSAAKDPNVAAAYIDFITSDEAMQVLVETGNVPVNDTGNYIANTEGVVANVLTEFDNVSQKGNILPYLDYATPTMDQALGDALQELLAGNSTPEEFTDTLEKNYAEFVQ
ncbi:MAG: sugar ABC transporter substrate-binding protein [Actinobacteria bacterium]|nr:MAG: sugar ABC transporter substrate-binding protein [Actinomycetota bacterium]